jgi:hypothetical protein
MKRRRKTFMIAGMPLWGLALWISSTAADEVGIRATRRAGHRPAVNLAPAQHAGATQGAGLAAAPGGGFDPVLVEQVPALADPAIPGEVQPMPGDDNATRPERPARTLLRQDKAGGRPGNGRGRRGLPDASKRFGARSPGGAGLPHGPEASALEIKRCLNCGREVPVHSQAGESCPYCGAHWGFEQQRDGTRRWTVDGWQIAKMAAAVLVLGGTIIIGLRRIFQ